MNINWFNKKMQLPDISFKERLEHMNWCIKNDITIILIQEKWNHCFIRIREKGKIIDYCNNEGFLQYYKQTKLKVNDPVWAKKVYELYSEYYIKYNPEFIPLKLQKKDE